MKRLKDKKIHEFTIRIDTIREHFSDGTSSCWGEKNWCVQIDNGYSKTSFGGCNSLRELFDKIEEELYINRKGFKELVRRKLNKWLS